MSPSRQDTIEGDPLGVTLDDMSVLVVTTELGQKM